MSDPRIEDSAISQLQDEALMRGVDMDLDPTLNGQAREVVGLAPRIRPGEDLTDEVRRHFLRRGFKGADLVRKVEETMARLPNHPGPS